MQTSQQKQTERRYVRAVVKGKKENYLNVSIPQNISKLLRLDDKSYLKLYLDEENRIIFEKLEVEQ